MRNWCNLFETTLPSTPCNYKPVGFQAESTVSALIPDYADVSVNSSLRLSLADPDKPRPLDAGFSGLGLRESQTHRQPRAPVGPVGRKGRVAEMHLGQRAGWVSGSPQAGPGTGWREAGVWFLGSSGQGRGSAPSAW